MGTITPDTNETTVMDARLRSGPVTLLLYDGQRYALTVEQQVWLLDAVADGRSAITQLRENPDLSISQQEDLQVLVDAAHDAINMICLANLRFLVKIARSYYPNENQVSLSDLVQAAFEGMYYSLWRFKQSEGTSIRTYALKPVIWAVKKEIRDYDVVLVPKEMRKRMYKVHNAIFDAVVTHEPKDDESIGKKLQITAQKVRFARLHNPKRTVAEENYSRKSERSLTGLMSLPSDAKVERSVMGHMVAEQFDTFLLTQDLRIEAQVRMTFAIARQEGFSLDEICRMLRFENVDQIYHLVCMYFDQTAGSIPKLIDIIDTLECNENYFDAAILRLYFSIFSVPNTPSALQNGWDPRHEGMVDYQIGEIFGITRQAVWINVNNVLKRFRKQY